MLPAPQSFWGSVVGNSCLTSSPQSTAPPLPVAHLMSYLPPVLYLPKFKNLMGISGYVISSDSGPMWIYASILIPLLLFE